MFFNNKLNTFFGLNLTLVYTFPMCMAWRFHFTIRNYDFKIIADYYFQRSRLDVGCSFQYRKFSRNVRSRHNTGKTRATSPLSLITANGLISTGNLEFSHSVCFTINPVQYASLRSKAICASPFLASNNSFSLQVWRQTPEAFLPEYRPY